MLRSLIAALVISLPAMVSAGDAWSFSVAADPRGGQSSWKNALLEMRNMRVKAKPAFEAPDFLLVAGDIDPLKKRYADYQEIFRKGDNMKAMMPVMGNHDGGDKPYMVATLIPAIPGVKVRDDKHANYYVDWKNVRVIALDGYSDLGARGVLNSDALKWAEDCIESAPANIDHIFVSFHEPAFPRDRHLKDSFNSDRKKRDAFWNMLIKHKDRVRAVFVGHTHAYYRMRVLDPSSDSANDSSSYPDDEGGIYQVDAGGAGNGRANVFVLVQIRGTQVDFRTLQAANGEGKLFKVKDEWSIAGRIPPPGNTMRTWTAKGGAKIKAVLSTASGGIAVLKTETGKTMRVNTSALSEADQLYIKNAKQPLPKLQNRR